MLQIKNLSKIYANGAAKITALSDLNINFGSKGLIVILGKSGCGKSTLINMIGGLDYPTKGEIIINGRSSKTFSKSELDSYRNTYVGVVFQEFNLIDEISVFENIDMTMKLQEKSADVNTVDEVLSMVGLNNLGYRKPSELSGGQRQRVALARALLKKPEVILADEPTGSLDSTTGEEVFESLKKIAQDKLVIVVTHDKELAYTYGERIVELQDGRIISDSTRQSEDSRDLKELSDNVIEVASPSKLSASHINKRLKNDEVNYIGLSYDKERIALAYSETVDSFYEKADAHRYSSTKSEDIKKDNKQFVLSKGKMPLGEAFKMARANIKRTKKRNFMLSVLTIFCFTFLTIAIIASSVNIPGLVAKGAFDTHSQQVISVTKTQTDEWGYINRAPIADGDAQSILSILGQSGYANHVELSFAPMFASGFKSESWFNVYEFDRFTGVLQGGPTDIGLELVEGSKEYCETPYELIISDLAAFELMRSGYTGYNADGKSGIFYPESYAKVLNARIQISDSRSYEKSTMAGFYKVVGIYKTDYEDYKAAMSASPLDTKAAELLNIFAQNRSFLYSKAFVSNGFVEAYYQSASASAEYISYEFLNHDIGRYGDMYERLLYSADNWSLNFNKDLAWSSLGDLKMPQKLNAGEIIISYDTAHTLLGYYNHSDNIFTDKAFLELVNNSIDIRLSCYMYGSNTQISAAKSYKIVGVLEKEEEGDKLWYGSSVYFCAEDLSELSSVTSYTTIYVAKTGTKAGMQGKIKNLMQNDFYAGSAMLDGLSIAELSNAISSVATVCLWVSLVFAVFAFLIIYNYMSSSVRFRRKEIAVYRVIGAKTRDIAKIFLSEGLIITIKNTIWVSVISWLVCWIINNIMSAFVGAFGITVKLISFTFFHPLIVFALIGLFFLLSSFIPINSITRKTPVEALKLL